MACHSLGCGLLRQRCWWPSVCMYLHPLRGKLLQSSQGHAMEALSPSWDAGASLSNQPLEIGWPAIPRCFLLLFFSSTTTRCSHQQSPYQLLSGEPHIFEDLLGLKICISPDAFFQVNIAGAEILYRTVGELSGVNSNTVLLDICCVTGKWQPRAESTCSLSPQHHPRSTQGPCSRGGELVVVVQA